MPALETYDDYPLRMFELITGLAEYEDRQASEVIDDILQLAGSEPSNGQDPAKAREAEVARH